MEEPLRILSSDLKISPNCVKSGGFVVVSMEPLIALMGLELKEKPKLDKDNPHTVIPMLGLTVKEAKELVTVLQRAIKGEGKVP